MLKVPQAERVEFFKILSAHLCFEQARKVLQMVIQQPHISPLSIPLWTAFFVIYAKPFRQQFENKKRGVTHSIRIDAQSFVPPYFQDAHKSLMEVRDKMYAHTDHQTYTDEDGYPLNGVFGCVNGLGELSFGMRSSVPPVEALEILLTLVKTLESQAGRESEKIWDRWAPHCPLPTGCWDLNVGADSDDLLLPLAATNVSPGSSEWPTPV